MADGRRLTFRTYGPPDGTPVIALHGTPGSRLKFSTTVEAAERLGLAIIAPDRWGYGGSDAPTSPTLAGYSDDIASLADALSLRHFAVMGVSGGGPFAAAVAVRLPDRTRALALVAPVGPIAGERNDAFGLFHHLCFGPLARNRLAPKLVFSVFRWLLHCAPTLATTIAFARAPLSDRLVLSRGSTCQRLTATFKEGLRPGPLGPVIDLALFAAPWELPFANAVAPACLWIGTADRNVPLSAALRLGQRLPDCSIESLPNEGHLWVAEHYEQVLRWIFETQKAKGVPGAAPVSQVGWLAGLA